MRLRMVSLAAFVLLAAAARTVNVPAGTPIHFKLLQTVNTNTAKAGQHVPAELTAPLVVDGVTIARNGAPAVVKITLAEESGRIGGSAKLRFSLHSIKLANGETAEVHSSSWFREGKAHGKHNATYIVGGAIAGALIGQAVGHDRNATAKGTAAGAGVGIGAAAATGKFDFSVKAGARFILKLKSAIRTTV